MIRDKNVLKNQQISKIISRTVFVVYKNVFFEGYWCRSGGAARCVYGLRSFVLDVAVGPAGRTSTVGGVLSRFQIFKCALTIEDTQKNYCRLIYLLWIIYFFIVFLLFFQYFLFSTKELFKDRIVFNAFLLVPHIFCYWKIVS